MANTQNFIVLKSHSPDSRPSILRAICWKQLFKNSGSNWSLRNLLLWFVGVNCDLYALSSDLFASVLVLAFLHYTFSEFLSRQWRPQFAAHRAISDFLTQRTQLFFLCFHLCCCHSIRWCISGSKDDVAWTAVFVIYMPKCNARPDSCFFLKWL